MKQYKYTAMNINKEKITGTFLAEDEKDLAVQLAKQNLFLVSASAYTGKTPSAFFTTGTGKVNNAELTSFCRQFSIMVNTGIPVLECLESLKNLAFSTYFKKLLQIIYEDVKSGVVLSDALNEHKKVFPEFFRNMIYVGEVSGKLDVVLSSLADYYERDATVKRKTKSALSYPLMLGGMTVGIVILMLAFVIPTFREALASLDVELSGLTVAIYAVSDFILSNGAFILAGIVVLIVLIIVLLRTEKGAYWLDCFKIRTPVIRDVQIGLIAARFARAFALMISSGMDIADALDSTAVIIGNRDARKRLILATEEVKHGSKLAVAFEKHHLFPPIMLQMIAIGERTASLDDILNRSCSFFDEQVESSLDSLTSKIQPIMLIIMGVVIALMFIAVYSPMISIMTGLL